VLQRRNFDYDHGVSNFHSGVGGQLQRQGCDPTTGQLMPVESSIETDHCTPEIHFKATVTIIRER
jgi:hypothetical protein